MNIIKQQGGMFGPNKNISEWCIPQNEGKSPKTRDKTTLKLGDCYPSKQGDTKDTMSVGWFSKALESVDEVRIITDGRINFIEPSTGLEKKGNSKGSMLLIWRPFISPRRMFTTVSKAALMAIGQGVRRAA